MGEPVSLLLAFAGGLLSFFSPCVLPLIPSWLCVIGGIRLPSGNAPPAEETRKAGPLRRGGTLLPATGAFVLGFTAVFVVMSIVLAGAVMLFSGLRAVVNLVSGLAVIALGVHVLSGFLGFLDRERRFHPEGRIGGIGGAFVAGLAFGAGWSPCVGPVLGSILLLAGQNGRVGEAVPVLAAWSAGLGLPFLGAALLFDRGFSGGLPSLLARIRPRLPLVRKASGVFLIVMGVLMLSGRYQALSGFLARGENSPERWLARAVPGLVRAEEASPLVRGAPSPGGPDIARALAEVGLPALPRPVPQKDFTLPALSGGDLSLSDHRGKAVFLNFWATWCPPCRAEMPAMEALWRRYSGEGLEIIAVNVGESRETAAAFMEGNGLGFPVALDRDHRVGGIYDIQAFPTTFLINREGTIVARITGALNWDSPLLDEVFAALLE